MPDKDDPRKAFVNWVLPPEQEGGHTGEMVHSALLMDLRDQLREITLVLRRIEINTQRPGKKANHG